MMIRRFLLSFYFLLCAGAALAAPQTVVLPERFAGSHVVFKNSPEYKSLAREFARQLNGEREARQTFEHRIDGELRDQARQFETLQSENAKLRAGSHGWLSSVLGPLFSVFSLALQFAGNPFGFIVTRLVELVAGIVAILFVLTVSRWAWRRWRRPRGLTLRPLR